MYLFTHALRFPVWLILAAATLALPVHATAASPQAIPCTGGKYTLGSMEQQACVAEKVPGFGSYETSACHMIVYLTDASKEQQAREILEPIFQNVRRERCANVSLEIRHGQYEYVDLHSWASHASHMLQFDKTTKVPGVVSVSLTVSDNRIGIYVEKDETIPLVKQALREHSIPVDAFTISSAEAEQKAKAEALASFATTPEQYNVVSEQEIEQMFDEARVKHGPPSADGPFSNNPYVIVFRGNDGAISYTYYFSDRGHFAHPSVFVVREIFAEDGIRTQQQAATAKTLDILEKWIQVLTKHDRSMAAFKADREALSHICGGLQAGSRKAIKCAEKVAREFSDSEWAHFNLGISYLHAGDERGTRRVFEVLKKKGDWLTVQLMFLGFGVGAMHPEWLEYFIEDAEFGNMVYEAQQLLDALGFETGPPRGVIGSQLENAIKAFQREANVKVDGQVTEVLLEQLRTWGKR